MDVTRRIVFAMGLILAFALITLALALVRVVLDWAGAGWAYWLLIVGFLGWYVWRLSGDLLRYRRNQR